MLVLNADDVSSVLTMSECIEAMAEALCGLANGTYWQPPRTKIRHDGATSMLGLMPSYRSGSKPVWGFKHIVVAPDNRTRGIDSHQGAVLLNDGETGRPIGLVDATSITAIRTAAVSAVATKTLARADAMLVAIVGTGVQAHMHVNAMRTILPHARVVIGARTQRAGEEFAGSMGVEAAGCIRDAVAGADVICTVTSSREPVLEREWIKPGCH